MAHNLESPLKLKLLALLRFVSSLRPYLDPQIGDPQITVVALCYTVAFLFLFGNNCSNID
jgi:hypothetical protein